MPYKTIILELLQSCPRLFDQLRQERMLLSVTDSLATMLKDRHEALKHDFEAMEDMADTGQAASAAMELAVKEMESRLQAALPANGQGSRPPDTMMAFVRSLTSSA